MCVRSEHRPRISYIALACRKHAMGSHFYRSTILRRPCSQAAQVTIRQPTGPFAAFALSLSATNAVWPRAGRGVMI